MTKTMTLKEARKTYPIGSTARVVKTGAVGRVEDHHIANVAFIGLRTFVTIHLHGPAGFVRDFTTNEIEAA